MSGTAVLGIVNKKMEEQVGVRVKDAEGNVLPRACVSFTVVVGDGRLVLPSTEGEGDQVTVRADDSGVAAVEYRLGKSTRIVPRFLCEDGRNCASGTDPDHYTQVGMNQVTAQAGAARLGEPFTFYALPDGQCEGAAGGACKAKLVLTSPRFRSGFFNLGIAGLMQVAVLDPYDNPLSNFDVRFAAHQAPTVGPPPDGQSLYRPQGTQTQGKVLKPIDHRKCIERDATPGLGDCAGEAAVVTVHSSSTGPSPTRWSATASTAGTTMTSGRRKSPTRSSPRSGRRAGSASALGARTVTTWTNPRPW